MNNPMLEVREALKWSQEQVASEIKCSLNTVRLCEKEGRLPQLRAIRENFDALAKRAGVKISQ